MDINTKDLEILIDYFEKVTGIEGIEPYEEIVLYAYDLKNDYLVHYVDGGTDDERIISYLVPKELYLKCLKIIKNNKMAKWNDLDGEALDGMIYVLKFKELNKLIKVSSNNMGKNGLKAFGEIKVLLNEYLNKRYLID